MPEKTSNTPGFRLRSWTRVTFEMQYEIWFVVDLKTDTDSASDTDDKE